MKHFEVLVLMFFLFSNVSSGKNKELDSLFQAGTTNLYNGNYDEAFSNFFEGKLLCEQLKDTLPLAQSLTYLGEVCRATQQFEQGLDYLNQALALGKQIPDSFTIAKALNRMAAIKYEQKEVPAAIDYAEQSLKIFQDIHEANLSANNLNILGALSTLKKDFLKAIGYYDQARKIMLTLPDQSDLPNILNNIANNYFLLGQYQNGIPYARQSFELASKNQTRVYMLEACRMMTRGDSGVGNFKEALHYSQLAGTIIEELVNEYKRAEKKMIEVKNQNILTSKENIFLKKINDENLRLLVIQRKLSWMVVAGIFIMAVLLITLMILYRQRKKSMKILSERNVLAERQKIKLQKLNNLKDNLLALISHDFRSPLISLEAMLQLIEVETESKAELNHLTQRVKKQVYETIDTLDNMLLWSRTQIQGSQVLMVALQVRQFSVEVLNSFEQELAAKNIIVQNDIHEALMTTSDREILKIILRNLLSNAIKFSHPGSTIFLSGKKTDRQLEISVKDFGIGISPEVRQKLFSNEHVSSKGTGDEKGIGLGLILAHELVTKLDGTISVQSELNNGSTFTVTLPNKDLYSPPANLPENEPPHSAGASGASI